MIRSHISVLRLLIICTAVFVVVVLFVLPIQYARSYSEFNPLPTACDIESLNLTNLATADRECVMQLIVYLENLIDERDSSDTDIDNDRSVGQETAETAIREAIDDFEIAETAVREAYDDGQNVTNAINSLDYAADLIDDAIATYNDAEYAEAIEFAEEAMRLIEDAFDEIGSRNDLDDRDHERDDRRSELDRDQSDIYGISRSRADNILTDGWFALKDLRKEIDEITYSYGYGQHIEAARELYEEARSTLYDAEDAYIDQRYTDAVDLVDEAQNIIDDAYDELWSHSNI